MKHGKKPRVKFKNLTAGHAEKSHRTQRKGASGGSGSVIREENARFLRLRRAGIFDIPGKPVPLGGIEMTDFQFFGQSPFQQGTIFSDWIPRVAFRVSTTS